MQLLTALASVDRLTSELAIAASTISQQQNALSASAATVSRLEADEETTKSALSGSQSELSTATSTITRLQAELDEINQSRVSAAPP